MKQIDSTKLSQNKNNKAIWERKAKTFPRFLSDSDDTLEIMQFFHENGVNFKGKSAIDIGCGNGRFAFHLAREAKSVLAVDISQKMLENLREDAKTLNLNNITTICSAWEDFKIDSHFEIALASLTPALNNKAGFIKATEIFEQYFCYVGWGRVRKCDFMDEILIAHNARLELPIGLPNVLEWLAELGVKNIKHYYMPQRFIHSFKNINEAIESIEWNIEAHGAVANKAKISEFIKKHEKDGKISYESQREVGIAIIERF